MQFITHPRLKTEPLKTASFRLRRSGMNYGIGKTYSVFLMSVRSGAPYRDLGPGRRVGCVVAHDSMSRNQSGEADIRRALIEADLMDGMVALPGKLFNSTQIPVCLWFLAKSEAADAKRGFRDRRKEMLFNSHTSPPALDQQTGIINLWHN